MKKERRIKAIVFDIGGVMILGDNLDTHYQDMCKHLNLDYNKFMSIRKKYIMKAAENKISGKKMIDLIAKELNMSYKKLLSNWVEYKKKSIKKNTVLEKIIKKLKIRGYIVASLSNVVDIHQKACNEKKIYSVFDFNILSFKVKLIKPDKRIYQLLLKKLKLPGNEVIFTDDYQSCLDGAKKLGINTLLFKNNQQFVKDLRKLGVKL